MVVALAVFDFHLPSCRGLKEKRAFLRPLRSRLRTGFEISASEVAHHDLLQRACVGVVAVGPDRSALEPLLSKVVEYVEGWAEESGVELTSLRSEFLEYGDVGAAGSSFGAAQESQ
ncbi:MAG TPA: DUF503 domain-containing protein [Thermoanaerobaculia bacterium]|nr:DUF503 domain-containing protein [Thermoanaerobaculia bacterium]